MVGLYMDKNDITVNVLQLYTPKQSTFLRIDAVRKRFYLITNNKIDYEKVYNLRRR